MWSEWRDRQTFLSEHGLSVFSLWRHRLFNFNTFLTPLVFGLFCLGSIQAQAAVQHVLSQDLVRVTQAEGKTTEEFIANVTEVLPKDVLREEIKITNTTSTPLTNVEVRVPVPKGTTFIGRTTPATERWTLTYSTDNGKTFAIIPVQNVSVLEQGRATIKQIPAPLGSYTDVKWTVKTLSPSETLTFSFRVQVK